MSVKLKEIDIAKLKAKSVANLLKLYLGLFTKFVDTITNVC